MSPLKQRLTLVVLGCAFVGAMGDTVVRAGTVAAGYGAIGDSYADEYQFYPPDRTHAVNFVEILATQRHLDFGSFSTISRGSPRNQGYANNWALDDATSADLGPQTAGLAGQIAAGQVKTGLVFVGGNDFIHAFLSPNPAQNIPAIPQNLLTNTVTAVSTLLAASPGTNVAVANVFDLSKLPITQQLIATGVLTQAQAGQVSQLISGYNAALAAAFAGNAHVAIIDVNTVANGLVSSPTLKIGGQTIDTQTPGDEFHHLFLNDGLHVGTVGQALIANGFISALDTQFSANISPLSEGEIIKIAQDAEAAAVPLPPMWASGAITLGCVFAAVNVRRRRRLSHHV
ncbi:MAG TPA: SGNH/GDSL hydrolase family protein [Tepidisphaeraceae bacterium]|nr:SGNH/GDSL hydrolase family protein [Tepidisphaeraceae bacterium]